MKNRASDHQGSSWSLLLLLAPVAALAFGAGLGGTLSIFERLNTAGEAMLPTWMPAMVVIFSIATVVIGGCSILWTGRPSMLALCLLVALSPRAIIVLLGVTQYSN